MGQVKLSSLYKVAESEIGKGMAGGAAAGATVAGGYGAAKGVKHVVKQRGKEKSVRKGVRSANSTVKSLKGPSILGGAVVDSKSALRGGIYGYFGNRMLGGAVGAAGKQRIRHSKKTRAVGGRVGKALYDSKGLKDAAKILMRKGR